LVTLPIAITSVSYPIERAGDIWRPSSSKVAARWTFFSMRSRPVMSPQRYRKPCQCACAR